MVTTKMRGKRITFCYKNFKIEHKITYSLQIFMMECSYFSHKDFIFGREEHEQEKMSLKEDININSNIGIEHPEAMALGKQAKQYLYGQGITNVYEQRICINLHFSIGCRRVLETTNRKRSIVFVDIYFEDDIFLSIFMESKYFDTIIHRTRFPRNINFR